MVYIQCIATSLAKKDSLRDGNNGIKNDLSDMSS